MEHSNVCGIPISIKYELRRYRLVITAGIPISMYLADSPKKTCRYCVYDPNTAVSAIYPDATFDDVFYTSPTRGG